MVENFQPYDVTVDGFTQYASINGIMRCVGFQLQTVWPENEPQKVIVLRLKFPVCCIDSAIFETRSAMATPIDIKREMMYGRH